MTWRQWTALLTARCRNLGRLAPRAGRLPIPALCLTIFAACGTLPNGKKWGEDATLFPGWDRVGESALNALTDPLTWAPLGGALVLQIDDWDRRVADWAYEHTPVFGSPEKASDARGTFGNVSDAVWGATLLLTPSGDEVGPWVLDKLKGTAVEGAARLSTLYTVEVLKDAVGRERPQEEGSTTSFPSEHGARLGVNFTLASRNLRAIPVSDTVRTLLNAGFIATSAAGGWSRVEAGDHYPSDVLVGLSIGHFLGAFITDAFLGLENYGVQWSVAPMNGGAMVACSIPF